MLLKRRWFVFFFSWLALNLSVFYGQTWTMIPMEGMWHLCPWTAPEKQERWVSEEERFSLGFWQWRKQFVIRFCKSGTIWTAVKSSCLHEDWLTFSRAIKCLSLQWCQVYAQFQQLHIKSLQKHSSVFSPGWFQLPIDQKMD